VQISEQDLRDSYNSFAADWTRSHPGQPVPAFDESRNQVQEFLMGQRIFERLDDWLGMVRDERQVEYREAAFQ
jgi:hypothetical protein